MTIITVREELKRMKYSGSWYSVGNLITNLMEDELEASSASGGGFFGHATVFLTRHIACLPFLHPHQNVFVRSRMP